MKLKHLIIILFIPWLVSCSGESQSDQVPVESVQNPENEQEEDDTFYDIFSLSTPDNLVGGELIPLTGDPLQDENIPKIVSLSDSTNDVSVIIALNPYDAYDATVEDYMIDRIDRWKNDSSFVVMTEELIEPIDHNGLVGLKKNIKVAGNDSIPVLLEFMFLKGTGHIYDITVMITEEKHGQYSGPIGTMIETIKEI